MVASEGSNGPGGGSPASVDPFDETGTGAGGRRGYSRRTAWAETYLVRAEMVGLLMGIRTVRALLVRALQEGGPDHRQHHPGEFYFLVRWAKRSVARYGELAARLEELGARREEETKAREAYYARRDLQRVEGPVPSWVVKALQALDEFEEREDVKNGEEERDKLVGLFAGGTPKAVEPEELEGRWAVTRARGPGRPSSASSDVW